MRTELEYGNDDETWEQQLAREADEREKARYQKRLAKGRASLKTMEQMQAEERAERHRRAREHEDGGTT